RVEEGAAGEAGELGLSCLHGLEGSFPVGRREAVEILAMGLARPLVRRRDAGAEEFAWVERELVAEFGLGFLERPIAVKPGATAVSAGELPVDECGDAALAARRRHIVSRDQRVGRRHD